MWYRVKEFLNTVTLYFLITLFYIVDWGEKVVERFKKKKKEYNPYGMEVLEVRNKELRDEIQRIADEHGVSYDVADSISNNINRVHKRIRTKTLFY